MMLNFKNNEIMYFLLEDDNVLIKIIKEKY